MDAISIFFLGLNEGKPHAPLYTDGVIAISG